MSGTTRIGVFGFEKAGKSSFLTVVATEGRQLVDRPIPDERLEALECSVEDPVSRENRRFTLHELRHISERAVEACDAAVIVVDLTTAYDYQRDLYQRYFSGMDARKVLVLGSKSDLLSSDAPFEPELQELWGRHRVAYHPISSKVMMHQTYHVFTDWLQNTVVPALFHRDAIDRRARVARQVRDHIVVLQRELNSAITINPARKFRKMQALTALADRIANNAAISIQDAVQAARAATPALDAGMFTSRTTKLLDRAAEL